MKRVRAKKHLGQHFLRDENIAQKIVEGLDSPDSKTILEVGPGMGVLTKYLLQQSGKEFYALDVDTESVTYLKESYPDHAEKFIYADFLKQDIGSYQSPISVIGNFPYNISSQLFFKIWDERDRIESVVCMIQKEVADRIVAKEGNKTYGILSVLLQAFFDLEYLFTVPPGVFDPPPKVQSAVIRLRRNQVADIGCDAKYFKRVVKTAFGKRRKTLRNALKDLALQPDQTEGKTFDLRAEQLSVQDFIDLTCKIST